MTIIPVEYREQNCTGKLLHYKNTGSAYCCVNRRWALPGLAPHLAFIPTMWLNELQRWATMPVWNLHLHLGPRPAPVDQRPQLETRGLGVDQCLWGGRYGHGGPTPVTEVSLCICIVDLYTFTQLCNLESARSTAAVPSVLFEVPWYVFFFGPWNTLQRALAVPPDRLQRSYLHCTEFEVSESLCERLFVCSQVILQDPGKEVTSESGDKSAYLSVFLSV